MVSLSPGKVVGKGAMGPMTRHHSGCTFDTSGGRANYKRAKFGEMTRDEFVAFAQAALKQNMTTARLLTNGRLTIPKAVRDALHLKAGVQLTFTLRSDGAVILRG